MNNKQELLRHLPKMDEILHLLEQNGVTSCFTRDIVAAFCRLTVNEMREFLLKAATVADLASMVSAEAVAKKVEARLKQLKKYRLRRVVNATGIILHTNLGRAPLCETALQRILDISRGYSNLEFDLSTGKRGERYDHVRELLCVITGAEDAVIVNNNAAAVLLALNALSEGREAVVSRGELIEIGGAFRIPEVMQKSGAFLREIGTTNRTHLTDYVNAINQNTGIILKVHTSNYKILGFTEEVDLPTLVELGKRQRIHVMVDLGSGCFVDLDRYGFEHEPTVQQIIRTGADVVTFSGDKLLGGPQAGIILGKKALVQIIKKNPLNRALRIDKLTLAALEATLLHYLNLNEACSHINILKALTEPYAKVEKKGQKLFDRINKLTSDRVRCYLKTGLSVAGGGSLPTQEIPSVLLALTIEKVSANRIEEKLRNLEVPVIARIVDDEVLFDVRTIAEEEFVFIEQGIQAICEAKS